MKDPRITLGPSDEVTVSVRHHGTWVIRHDPRWGISIDCVGSSSVPKCVPIAERPDLCKEMLDPEAASGQSR